MCGSKRRLKFRLRNTIVLFFIVLFGQNIFYFPKVLRTLSQCCQQSNHRNILKDLLFFFFTYSQHITRLFFTKRWKRKVHVFVSSLDVGSYPNSAASYHTKSSSSTSIPGPLFFRGGKKRNTGNEVCSSLFVTHAHHSKDSDPLLSSQALCLLDLQRKQNS